MQKRASHAEYLLDLKLDSIGRQSDTTIQSLCTVLEHAANLERFALRCTESEDSEEVSIVRAASQLTSIRHLKLDSPAMDVLRVIKNTWASPLTTIKVSFDMEVADEEGEEWADPVWLFSRFRDSLREVHVDTLTLEQPRSMIYPGVTKLELDNCVPCDVQALARAYPGLRELAVHFHVMDHEEMAHNYEVSSRSADEYWDALEAVEGSVQSVYLCALPSRVQRMKLSASTEWAFPGVLAQVVDTAQPSHLELNITHNKATTTPVILFLQEATATVTHLYISFTVTKGCSAAALGKNFVSLLVLCFAHQLTLSSRYYSSGRCACTTVAYDTPCQLFLASLVSPRAGYRIHGQETITTSS